MSRLVLAAALLLVACGVKTRPLAPELVRPEPPTTLVAASTPDGVRLTWRRPVSYSGGRHMRDLGGFDVDRATGADSVDFTRAGRFELNDQTRFRQERSMEWIDTSAEVGTTYRYRIVAYTTDGYRSEPSESVVISHRAVTPPAPPTPSR